MARSLEEGPDYSDRHCVINALTGEIWASPELSNVYWICQPTERCDILCSQTGEPYIIIDVMSDPIHIVYDPEKEASDAS